MGGGSLQGLGGGKGAGLEGKVLAAISPSPGLLSGRADLRRGLFTGTRKHAVMSGEGAAPRHAGGSGEGHRHAVCAELYSSQALSHDWVGVGQRLQSYFTVIKVGFQSG